MQLSDKPKFAELISSVHAFFNRDVSDFAISVWWEAFKGFDYEAVSEALTRHCMNPDNGQYAPKPADIVKLLRGSTQDSALVAWAKVDKGLRSVGTYRSVSFDDPIILQVLQDMGGWVSLGTKTEAEWPFVAREFENRYRGYANRPSQDYPRWLPGIAESQNMQTGLKAEPPVLIGDPAKAKTVLLGGSDVQRVGFQQLTDVEFDQVLGATEPRRLQA